VALCVAAAVAASRFSASASFDGAIALWKLQGYALLGLATGSPDWAIGAVVSRSF